MTAADTIDADEAPAKPVFEGTPEDWWDAAEEIPESQAAEKNFGDWYITMIRNPAGATPAFRVATPSKPPNETKRLALASRLQGDPVSAIVRRLIRVETPVAAWMTAEFVMADLDDGSAERGPWRRSNSGRWQRVTDGRISVNDNSMRELNPRPATFS